MCDGQELDFGYFEGELAMALSADIRGDLAANRDEAEAGR